MNLNTCKLTYISGPIIDPRGTWYTQQNLREAESLAAALWQMGLAVLCWHKNIAGMDGIVQSEAFLVAALTTIKRCDLFVLLPTWEEAIESRAEKIIAEESHIPIYTWPIDCPKLMAIGSGQPIVQETIKGAH